jgi:hypothetical protein
MEFDKTVDDTDRLARILLAAALALVAAASYRKNRLVGVLAGIGAAGIGYTVAVQPPEAERASGAELEVETTTTPETETAAADDDHGMRCAACKEPIVVGESRRPNRENRIVHESCL